MRPAGHPETGLNTMTGFTGARPDKQFHSRNITDTNGSLDVNVELLTSTELCCASVKAGSCCLHGDSVMVPELQRNGDRAT